MTDDKFTVQAAVDGKLQLSDLRMDPATLAHQAVVAEDGGNPQLAENFLRAAELATLDGDEVMSLYEALRPHRSNAEELEALRASLEARGAARCAELVRTGRGRVCPPGSPALIVAGIDVGNHTTEIVLARVRDGGVEPIAHGQAPTRGRKGSRNRWRERRRCCTSWRSRPPWPSTNSCWPPSGPWIRRRYPLPPASSPRSPVRSLRKPDARTPAGTGSAVGRHVPLAALAGDCIRWPRNRFRRFRHRL